MRKTSGVQPNETKIQTVVIPAIQRAEMVLEIEGDTPLIVSKFSEKAQRQIEEKVTHKQKGKRRTEARDPHAEFRAALHILSDGRKPRYGFPAGGIKKCAVLACRYLDDVRMTYAQGAFHVVGDPVRNLVEIVSSEPKMRTDMVRLKGIDKNPDVRYRPEFRKWRMQIVIRYNPAVINPQSIANLFNYGGFHIGLGEGRPSTGSGALNFGTFHVVTTRGRS